jgi:hypothetical protein
MTTYLLASSELLAIDIYPNVKHLACVVTHVSQWCLREAKNLKNSCMIKAIKHKEANL